MKFIAFDLETTGVDVETAEVVQAAAVEAVLRTSHLKPQGYQTHVLDITSTETSLFFVPSIPEGATAVHGIRAQDVVGKPTFMKCVDSFVRNLIAADVVLVSFNGAAYDIPIVARYVSQFGVSHTEWEARLRLRHIDVMRLWWRVKQSKACAPWQEALAEDAGTWTRDGHYPYLTADMFAGSLTAAHGFMFGEGFDDAHDATIDCTATLRVLGKMLSVGMTVDDAIKWSNEPLPGDVDFAGKFKWQGERCVIAFGKQAGTPIEQVERGFLQWMLGKDFPADTKGIVRAYLKTGEVLRRSAT